jgi:hypothetical protein
MTASFIEFFEKRIVELKAERDVYYKQIDAFMECNMRDQAIKPRSKAQEITQRIWQFQNRIDDIRWKEKYDSK